MEGLFVKKTNEEFVKAGVFEPNQYGFTAGLGRDDKLLDQFEWLTGKLDSGVPCDAVYFDFSRAFDVIDHSRLIKRFNDYGMSGQPLRWLQAWLGTGTATNEDVIRVPNRRKQFVQIGAAKSTLGIITSGVMQGSKIGPFAFKVYINDLLEELNKKKGHIRALCYADDLTLLGASSKVEEVQQLQELINVASKWAVENKLAYNQRKIFVLHHSTKSVQNGENRYYLDGDEIQKTETQKDLGVIIDQQLTLSKHHEKCAQKLAGACQKVTTILRSASYRVKEFVWSTYLVPIAMNGVLVARSMKRKIVEIYNKPYKRIFSNSKPREGMKIALPIEMNWALADLGWLQKLHENKLKNFEVSQYLVQDNSTPTLKKKHEHGNLYLLHSGPNRNTRQRGQRLCDSTNPLCRGKIRFGAKVNAGGLLSSARTPMARSAQIYDSLKPEQEGWTGIRQEIENAVFPSLFSYDIYKKLENGSLLSQYDAYQKKIGSLATFVDSDLVTL